MKPKERVAAAFDGEPTDHVPVHHGAISSAAASALLGRDAYVGGGIQQWREALALWQGEDAHQEYIERSYQDAIDLSMLLDCDIIRASYWRHPRKPSRQLDANTFLFAEGDDESQWEVMRCDPAKELCSTTPYHPRQTEQTFEDLEEALAASEKTIAEWRPQLPGMETRCQQMHGDEYVIRCSAAALAIPRDPIWMEAVVLRPDLVCRELDLQVEYARRQVPLAASLGMNYMFGGGDFASSRGPLYSPKVFHELVLPRLKQIANICHEHGCRHLFASDGDVWPVADDLFGASGVDGFYEIDRRAGMDMRKLHDRFPDLTTVGNIASYTLHRGTKDEVVREAEEAVIEAKRFSKTVVGVSNQIVPGTPTENVEAMLETIRTLR